MIRFVWLLLAVLTCTQAKIITLDGLFDIAQERSARLKMAKSDSQIEKSRLDTLLSSYYPTISLGYGVEYNKKLDDGIGSNASIGDTVIYSGATYEDSLSLRLNYELYHFGTTAKQADMQRNEIMVKKYDECTQKQTLFLQILEHYSKALIAQIEYTSRESIISTRKELFHIKERLFQAGKEPKSTIADEAIAIINLEREAQRAKMRYDEAIVALSTISTEPIDPKSDTLEPFLMQAPSKQPLFEESAQAFGLKEKIDQKEHEIDMHFRSQLPIISAYGNYYLYGSDEDKFSTAFKSITSNSYNIGISIRVDLFAGFKYNHESQRLRLELERTKQEYELQEQEYNLQIKSAQVQAEHLEKLLDQERVLAKETEIKTNQIKKLRKAGQGDALSELSVHIEHLEHEMNRHIEETQMAYQQKVIQTHSLQCVKKDFN